MSSKLSEVLHTNDYSQVDIDSFVSAVMYSKECIFKNFSKAMFNFQIFPDISNMAQGFLFMYNDLNLLESHFCNVILSNYGNQLNHFSNKEINDDIDIITKWID